MCMHSDLCWPDIALKKLLHGSLTTQVRLAGSSQQFQCQCALAFQCQTSSLHAFLPFGQKGRGGKEEGRERYLPSRHTGFKIARELLLVVSGGIIALQYTSSAPKAETCRKMLCMFNLWFTFGYIRITSGFPNQTRFC